MTQHDVERVIFNRANEHALVVVTSLRWNRFGKRKQGDLGLSSESDSGIARFIYPSRSSCCPHLRSLHISLMCTATQRMRPLSRHLPSNPSHVRFAQCQRGRRTSPKSLRSRVPIPNASSPHSATIPGGRTGYPSTRPQARLQTAPTTTARSFYPRPRRPTPSSRPLLHACCPTS